MTTIYTSVEGTAWLVLDDEVIELIQSSPCTDTYPAQFRYGHNDYLAANSWEHFEELAEAYWEDMANGSPREFVALFGEETIITNALNGNELSSLWSDAGVDGTFPHSEYFEIEKISDEACDELGLDYSDEIVVLRV